MWCTRLFIAALVLRVVFPVEVARNVFIFQNLVSAKWKEGLFPRWWNCLIIAAQSLQRHTQQNTGKPLIPLQVNCPWIRGYYVLFSSVKWMSLWSNPPWKSRNYVLFWKIVSGMMQPSRTDSLSFCISFLLNLLGFFFLQKMGIRLFPSQTCWITALWIFQRLSASVKHHGNCKGPNKYEVDKVDQCDLKSAGRFCKSKKTEQKSKVKEAGWFFLR